MTSDFPRILSLLRQEMKISQRAAASDLGVSQALLSHYENGVREPGLAFVIRAASYYGVSCDYLLGNTMLRDGSLIAAESIPDVSREKDNILKGNAYALLQKKLIVNSAALIFELLSACPDREFVCAVSDYLAMSLYKTYRYIYMASKNTDSMFSVPANSFSELCDAEMKLLELKIKNAACGHTIDGGKRSGVALPDMSQSAISATFPAYFQSLLTLLHSVSENLSPRISAEKQ